MAWKDPIVEEVRAAGRELEVRANGDVHQFFENLRRVSAPSQRRRAQRTAVPKPRKRSARA